MSKQTIQTAIQTINTINFETGFQAVQFSGAFQIHELEHIFFGEGFRQAISHELNMPDLKRYAIHNLQLLPTKSSSIHNRKNIRFIENFEDLSTDDLTDESPIVTNSIETYLKICMLKGYLQAEKEKRSSKRKQKKAFRKINVQFID